MAQALEALWPADAPFSGLVVTRYDHIPPRPARAWVGQRMKRIEAAHPCLMPLACRRPTHAGAHPGLTADDLVICLISGGGSALLTLPADGLTLAGKQRINKELLAMVPPLAR